MENSTNHSPSLYNLMENVLNTNLSSKEKIDLINELRKNNPVSSDRWAPRVAIWVLGITTLVTVICITIIIMNGKPGNDYQGLIAIASAAVGGLAGLISQAQRTTNDNKI